MKNKYLFFLLLISCSQENNKEIEVSSSVGSSFNNILTSISNSYKSNNQALSFADSSFFSSIADSLLTNNKKKPLLFLKVSDNYCSECCDIALDILKKANGNNERLAIVILGSFSSVKSKVFFEKKYNVNIIEYETTLEAEQSLQPFLFIYQNQIVSNFFFPVKEVADYNSAYVQSLLKL